MRRAVSAFMILAAAALPVVADGPGFTDDVSITDTTPALFFNDNSPDDPDWKICVDTGDCFGGAGMEHSFNVSWAGIGGDGLPFVIQDGMPDFLLYLGGGGADIGIGTSTPGYPISIVDSLPEIHLKDTSNGAGEGFIQLNTNTFILEGNGGQDVIEFEVTAPFTMDIDAAGDTTFFGDLQVNSSREVKQGIEEVDGREVLARLRYLPIHRWSYTKDEERFQHMGPMAEDFHAAFGLGQTDKHISVIDSAGVALASVQALVVRVESLEEENARLQAELAEVRSSAAADARMIELERRLALLEKGFTVTVANR